MPFDPDAYTRRVLAARRLHLAIDARILAQLDRLLEQHAAELARRLAMLPAGARQELAHRIVAELYDQLERDLIRLQRTGMTLQFSEIKATLDRVTYDAVASEVGRIRVSAVFTPVPPLQAAQAFLARRGTAHTFATLSRTVEGAAIAVDDLVTEALVRGWSPERLARRIRPYVLGNTDFTAEELRDLRTVPKARRDQARELKRNTTRIAVSEMGTAAHEAQVQSMIEAPMVEAWRWRLSPVRGTQQDKPDECDLLATQDIYGLGPGLYPVKKVPVRPHPNDRCWGQSKTRPVERWKDAKPNPEPVREPTAAGLEELTPRQQDAAVASAKRAIENGARVQRVAA